MLKSTQISNFRILYHIYKREGYTSIYKKWTINLVLFQVPAAQDSPWKLQTFHSNC